MSTDIQIQKHAAPLQQWRKCTQCEKSKRFVAFDSGAEICIMCVKGEYYQKGFYNPHDWGNWKMFIGNSDNYETGTYGK